MNIPNEGLITLLNNKYVGIGDRTQARTIKLKDIPEYVRRVYANNPNTNKSTQPALISHTAGYRVDVDSFNRGDEVAEGNFICVDLDNIHKPDAGKIDISNWIINHRDLLFNALGVSSNIAAIQKSASGNIHVLLYAPYKSKDEFDSRVGVYTAAFARMVYRASNELIDLREPIMGDSPIIDEHSLKIHQLFGLSGNPFYINENIINFKIDSETYDKLKVAYPSFFHTDVTSVDLSQENVHINNRTKDLKQLEYKQDHLHYNDRYRIANTLRALGFETESIIEFLKQYSSDKDIKGIAKCSVQKFQFSPWALRWLKERGLKASIKITNLDDDTFKDIRCPITERLNNIPTIKLNKGEYLGDHELIKDKNRVEIYADCGTGKTEFCFKKLGETVGDLVVPMNSTLNGKHSSNVNIIHSPSKWNPDVSQTFIYDTLARLNGMKPITFIDEYHLLIEQQNFRSVCFDIQRKISETQGKVVTLTGTPYEISNNVGTDYYHVVKNDGFKKELEINITDDTTKCLFTLVTQEVDKGNLVLLPTNTGLDVLKGMLVEKYGSNSVGEYRRDRFNEDDVLSLNNDNKFVLGVKVLFCTSYLNVGCELKGYDNVVTIVNISKDKFTGQQLHQFANRIRACDHRIIMVVKNNIDIMLYSNSIYDMNIEDDRLVEVMENSNLVSEYVKSQLRYFEDDLDVNKDKKTYQIHCQALMDFYSQFPVVVKYMLDMGYKTTYNIIKKESLVGGVMSDENIKEYIINTIRKDPKVWFAEYRSAMYNRGVVFNKQLQPLEKSLETGEVTRYGSPRGNFTDSICKLMERYVSLGLDLDTIFGVFDKLGWVDYKIRAYFKIFQMVKNQEDDKLSGRIINTIRIQDDEVRNKVLAKMAAELSVNMNKDTREIIKRLFRYISGFIKIVVGSIYDDVNARKELENAEISKEEVDAFIKLNGMSCSFNLSDLVDLLYKVEAETRVTNQREVVVFDPKGNEVASGSIREICEIMGWKRVNFDMRSRKDFYKNYEIVDCGRNSDVVVFNNTFDEEVNKMMNL